MVCGVLVLGFCLLGLVVCFVVCVGLGFVGFAVFLQGGCFYFNQLQEGQHLTSLLLIQTKEAKKSLIYGRRILLLELLHFSIEWVSKSMHRARIYSDNRRFTSEFVFP